MKGNPFNYSSWVQSEYFSNREEIIGKILEITVTGNARASVWITGERQVGKTSLLKHIEINYNNGGYSVEFQRIQDKFRPVFIYVNCQANRNENDFYNTLIQGMILKFDFKVKRQDNPYSLFIEWIKKINTEKLYIIFLLDEFDAFLHDYIRDNPNEAAYFLGKLNMDKEGIQGIRDSPQIISFVFCSNHTLEEMNKTLGPRGSGLTINAAISMPWFTEEQVRALASKYLVGNSVIFSRGEMDVCYKMTKGYPVFVQLMYSIMYEEKEKHPNPDKVYIEAVKLRYESEMTDMVKRWGQMSLPERTLAKLKELAQLANIEKLAKLIKVFIP